MFENVFTKLETFRWPRNGGMARWMHKIRTILGSPEIGGFERSETGLDEGAGECSPCLQAEIGDGRGDLGTTLTLFNRGRGRAYDIQIQPIGMEQGTVTFRKIRAIASGEVRQVLPNLDARAVLHKHDITGLLMVEWKSLKDSTIKELSVGASVTYRDAKENCFETCFEVTFYPFEDSAPTEWGGRPKMVEATTYECHRLGKTEPLAPLQAQTRSGLHPIPGGSSPPLAS